MSYPSVEKRLPRAAMTKTLARLLARLDESHKAVFASGEASVRAVWAVGSYARGALTCGDLDLVVELDSKRIRGSEANRILFNSPARIRTYIGTPADNSAHVEFTEAVLVWQPGLDWKVAMESIQLNESAARFSRPSDEIPLRLEQLSGTWDTANEILAGKADGTFNWSFVPLESVTPVLPVVQTFEEHKMARTMRLRVKGKANQALVPYLQGLSRMWGNEHLTWDIDGRADIYQGGTQFFLASLWDPSVLSDISVKRVVVVPHLSTRGPNGFWVVERGANHPLTKLFSNSKAWVVASSDGKPVVVGYGHVSSDECVSAVDLFSQASAAAEFAAESDEVCPFEDGPRRVVPFEGTELLNLLADFDMLTEGLPDTVFSEKGLRRALWCGFPRDELEVATPAQVAEAFKSTAV